MVSEQFILGKKRKMAKKAEERFRVVEQEIVNIQTKLQRLLELEAKITKHLEKINSQNEESTLAAVNSEIYRRTDERAIINARIRRIDQQNERKNHKRNR